MLVASAIAELLAAKSVARKIATRMLRISADMLARRPCILTATASLLEWVINGQRIVQNKTIRAICAGVAASQKSLHIIHPRAAASQEADSAHIKIVWQLLCNVSRRLD